VHEILDWQVSDVIERSQRELSKQKINSVADVRKATAIIQPSDRLAEKKTELEKFLFDKVYRHPGVLVKRSNAQRALRESFTALVADPQKLPAKFRRLADREGIRRAAADYLAGMTDRFALEEHKRLVAG
jgi:dGTPase